MFASLETIVWFKKLSLKCHFATYEEIKSLFLKQEESLFSSGREMIANVENNQWLNSNGNNVENCMTYFYLKLLGRFRFLHIMKFPPTLMSHITSCFSTSSRRQWSQISSMFSGRNSSNYLRLLWNIFWPDPNSRTSGCRFKLDRWTETEIYN